MAISFEDLAAPGGETKPALPSSDSSPTLLPGSLPFPSATTLSGLPPVGGSPFTEKPRAASAATKKPIRFDDLAEPRTPKTGVGDYVIQPLRGLGRGGALLGETVGELTAVPAIAADWAVSKWTGKQSTELRDWWFLNTVDPWVARKKELEPEGDIAQQGLHTVGNVAFMLAEAFMTGGRSALEPFAARGSVGLMETGLMRSGTQAAREAAEVGIKNSTIPAVQTAMETGSQVLEETGDKEQAARAAVQEYVNSTMMMMAPAASQGVWPGRIASGAAVGVVQNEASRLSRNEVVPESMRAPFTVEGAVSGAILGGMFGLMGKNPEADATNWRRVVELNKMALDEAVVADPVKAEEAAAHVEAVDPKLAKMIRRHNNKWKNATPEQLAALGEAVAKSVQRADELKLEGETAEPEVSQVTGKPFKSEETLKAEMEAAIEQPALGESPRPEPLPGETPAEYQKRLDAEKLGGVLGDRPVPMRREDMSDWELEWREHNSTHARRGAYMERPVIDRSLPLASNMDPTDLDMTFFQAQPVIQHYWQNMRARGFDSNAAHIVDNTRPDATVKDLMADLTQKDNNSYTKLGKALLKALPDDVGVQFVNSDHAVLEGAPAHYDPATKMVRIGLNANRTNDTFLIRAIWHESVHAAAYEFMRKNPKHPNVQAMRDLMAETKKRARRIQKEYNKQVPGDAQKPGTNLYNRLYGMRTPHEFVAEALSNPQFMRFLVNSEKYRTPGWRAKELVSAFGNLIRKMLRLPAGETADLLHSVMGTTRKILEEAPGWRVKKAAEDAATLKRLKERQEANKAPVRIEDEVGKRRKGKEYTTLTNSFDALFRTPVGTEGTSYWARRKATLRLLSQELDDFGRLGRRYNEAEREILFSAHLARAMSQTNNKTLSDVRELVLQGKIEQAKQLLQDNFASVEPKKSALERVTDRWGAAAAKMTKALETPPSDTPDPDGPQIYKAGVPMIGSAVRHAFKFGLDAARKIPGFSVAEGEVKAWAREIARNMLPEAQGDKAELAAAVVSKATATWKAMNSQIDGQSTARKKFWNLFHKKSADFIDALETGRKFTGPDANIFEEMRTGYKNLMEFISGRDKQKGIHYKPIDNYITHLFENPEGVAEYMKQKYGAKFGDPYFMKNRMAGTYKELVAKGFKPLYTNPEDIMMARWKASNIAHAKVDMFNEFAELGLARPAYLEVKGDDGTMVLKKQPVPKGWPDRIWRSPNGKKYYVEPESASILHNAFETKSLWNDPRIFGKVYRGGMWIKNKIVPLRLFGLFHAAHIGLLINNAAAFTRASKLLLAEQRDPAAIFKAYVEAFTPLSGNHLIDTIAARGPNRLLKAWRGEIPEATLTDADRQILAYMNEAGFVPGMAEQDKGTSLGKFKEAMQQQRYGKAALHSTFALIDGLQYPMFHSWIPTLKVAAFTKDVAVALKVKPELLTDSTARMQALAKIRKSIDNRFGEMNYDTLFWNRQIKDVAVLSTLSLGWQLGFIREYGGGMVEIAKASVSEQSIKQLARDGKLDRAMFASAYVVGAAFLSGLMTKLLTGEDPEPLDYFYPRTGEKDASGKDRRVNTPFFNREFAAIYMHMRNEGVVPGLTHLVQNKASGVVGLVEEIWNGVDSLGQEIRDPDAPAYKQLLQTMEAVFGSLEPISSEGARKSKSELETTLAVSGFSPAPKYATETKLEGDISATYYRYNRKQRIPYMQAQLSADKRELRRLYEASSPQYDTKLAEIKQKYQLSAAQMTKISRSLKRKESEHVHLFKALNWRHQKRILDEHWAEMTPEERKMYVRASNEEKLRYHYEGPTQ